jgi:hypothetical protein
LQQNNATTTKPTETSGLEHLDAPGPHSASKIQRREEEQVTPAIKTHKNRNNENKAEKFKSQDRGVDEILEPPLQSPSPPPPSQPQLLSTTNAFHDWYLAEIADNFEPEIEALNDADAPVGSKVLIQALESNLALFSPQERKVALSESN